MAKERTNYGIDITANTNDAEQGFQKVSKAATQMGSDIEKAFDTKGSADKVVGDTNKIVSAFQKLKDTLTSKLNLNIDTTGVVDKVKTEIQKIKPNIEGSIIFRGLDKTIEQLNKLQAKLKETQAKAKVNVPVETKTKDKSKNVPYDPAGLMSFSLPNMVANFGRISKGIGSAFEVAGRLLGTLMKMQGPIGVIATGVAGITLGLAGAYAAGSVLNSMFETMRTLITAVLGPGIDLAKTMESARLGIAGTLMSMGELPTGAIEYNDALKIGTKLMNDLQIAAIKTSATTKDLVGVFQGLVAQGLSAKMTLDEIKNFTIVGVNAVKALNLPPQQYLQELRDLVQGGIRPASSSLAASLGLTDADIQKAKGSADGLYKFLMNRLQGYEKVMRDFPDTYAGIMSNIEEYSTLASKYIEERYSKTIKAIGKQILDLFGSIKENSQGVEYFEVNPMIITIINTVESIFISIKEVLIDIASTFGDFTEQGFKFNAFTKDLFEGFLQINSAISALFTSVSGVNQGMGLTSKAVMAIVGGVLRALALFIRIVTIIPEIFNWLGRIVLNALGPGAKLLESWGINADKVATAIGSVTTALAAAVITQGLIVNGALLWSKAIGAITLAVKILTLGVVNLKAAMLGLAKSPMLIAFTAFAALVGPTIFSYFDKWGKGLSDKFGAENKEDKKISAEEEKVQKELEELMKQINPKYQQEANKQMVADSQKALRAALSIIKATMDGIKDSFKELFDELEVAAYNQNIGPVELLVEQEKLRIQEAAALREQEVKKYEAIAKATYDNEDQREQAIAPVAEAIRQYDRSLKLQLQGLNDLLSSLGKVTLALDQVVRGKISQPSLAGPNVQILSDIDKRIIGVIGKEFFPVFKSMANTMSKMKEDFVGPKGGKGIYGDLAKQLGIDSGNVENDTKALFDIFTERLKIFGGDIGKTVASMITGDIDSILEFGVTLLDDHSKALWSKIMGQITPFGSLIERQENIFKSSIDSQEKYAKNVEKINLEIAEGIDFENVNQNLKNFVPKIEDMLGDYAKGATITSGYRDEERNRRAGGSPTSYHLKGEALDIALDVDIDTEAQNRLKERFEQVFDEVLYHDVGSGVHLHLAGLKENYKTAANYGKSLIDKQTGKYVPTTKQGVVGAKEIEEFRKFSQEIGKQYENIKGISIGSELEKLYDSFSKNVKKINAYVGQFEGGTKYAEAQKQGQELLNQLNFNYLIDKMKVVTNQAEKYITSMFSVIKAESENALAGITQGVVDPINYIKQTLPKAFDDARAGLIILYSNAQKFKELGATDEYAKTLEEINKFFTGIKSIVDSTINAIDEQFNYFKSMHDAEYRLTPRQRERIEIEDKAIWNTAKADAYAQALKDIRQQMQVIAKFNADGSMTAGFKNLSALEQTYTRLEAIARKQGEIVTLNMEVEKAARTAFEEGMNKFLTESIFEAETLADALRELLVGILKSIQQVFAQKITDQMSDALFGTKNTQIPATPTPTVTVPQTGIDTASITQTSMAFQTLNPVLQTTNTFMNTFSTGLNTAQNSLSMFAQKLSSFQMPTSISSSSSSSSSSTSSGYATGGYISGRGTGTSDSILARISNGEYVVKAQAVKNLGVDFLNAVNSGEIYKLRAKLPKFAKGGAIGNTGMQGTARGMTSFAKNIGTNVSSVANFNIGLYRNEDEAIRSFMTSREGKKIFVDLNQQNNKVLNRILLR